MPNNDRVSAAKRSYVVGLHTADRLGFEAGYRGEPPANPYKRADFAQCYTQGWRRGSNHRISKLRGKAKTRAIMEQTTVLFGPALRSLASK